MIILFYKKIMNILKTSKSLKFIIMTLKKDLYYVLHSIEKQCMNMVLKWLILIQDLKCHLVIVLPQFIMMTMTMIYFLEYN